MHTMKNILLVSLLLHFGVVSARSSYGPFGPSAVDSNSLTKPGIYCLGDSGTWHEIVPHAVRAINAEAPLSFSRRTVLRLKDGMAPRRSGLPLTMWIRAGAYVRSLDGAMEDNPDSVLVIDPLDLMLVQLEVKADHRELETAISNCYVRREGVDPDRILPCTITKLSDGLYQLTTDDLEAGEYALVQSSAVQRRKDPIVLFDLGTH